MLVQMRFWLGSRGIVSDGWVHPRQATEEGVGDRACRIATTDDRCGVLQLHGLCRAAVEHCVVRWREWQAGWREKWV